MRLSKRAKQRISEYKHQVMQAASLCGSKLLTQVQYTTLVNKARRAMFRDVLGPPSEASKDNEGANNLESNDNSHNEPVVEGIGGDSGQG